MLHWRKYKGFIWSVCLWKFSLEAPEQAGYPIPALVPWVRAAYKDISPRAQKYITFRFSTNTEICLCRVPQSKKFLSTYKFLLLLWGLKSLEIMLILNWILFLLKSLSPPLVQFIFKSFVEKYMGIKFKNTEFSKLKYCKLCG